MDGLHVVSARRSLHNMPIRRHPAVSSSVCKWRARPHWRPQCGRLSLVLRRLLLRLQLLCLYSCRVPATAALDFHVRLYSSPGTLFTGALGQSTPTVSFGQRACAVQVYVPSSGAGSTATSDLGFVSCILPRSAPFVGNPAVLAPVVTFAGVGTGMCQ